MTATVTYRGDWMQTYTGRAFYPMAPSIDDIDPADIAHALGMLCRYGGHVSRFYSVAEHCVLMSNAVAFESSLWALLHDATEAYCGDMIQPIKRSMPGYRAMEWHLQQAIADRFALPTLEPPDEVKEADTRILLDERDALMAAPPQSWGIDGLAPLGVRISGWQPYEAEQRYLARLTELTA